MYMYVYKNSKKDAVKMFQIIIFAPTFDMYRKDCVERLGNIQTCNS